MSYAVEIKTRAIQLREAGFSIKEIAKMLRIAVSTSSVWLRGVTVSTKGKKRMTKQASLHRYKMSLRWAEKRSEKLLRHKQKAMRIIDRIDFSQSINRLICAVLFWAEGEKTNRHLAFTNSDPNMIALFLCLLRQSYKLDEKKFRISMHLHDYHDVGEMYAFWSETTSIAKNQFIKPYIKPHTMIRKRKNYRGCITIRYYDSEIACQLEALYNALHTA
jgi:DNA-binding transcriptional MerR regulator